ncbi:hybrid sensor histidine kinase/response regulator [Bdellovibrio sp. qaytius]|nr:hybrid sensor histidine kinase/response regulator [Bdellovibrio sp. qaytius]
MAQAILNFDWSKTEIGPIETWDIALITSLRMILSCPISMCLTWGPERRYFYNDAYVPILQQRHPQALGSTLQKVWSEVWEQILALALKVDAGGSVHEADMLFNIEVEGQIQETYFTFSYSPLYNSHGKVSGMLCTIIDTTSAVIKAQRTKTTEENLARTMLEVKAERLKLHTVLEKAPIGMAVVDGPEHKFILTNDYYRDLFLGSRDAVGSTVKDLFPLTEERGFIQMLDDIYQTGQPVEGRDVQFKSKRADGSEFLIYADFIYQPIRDMNDNIEGILLAVNNVTQRVRAVENLQTAKLEAESANQAKSAFLANMSHEIRTPLGAILGFAEIIRAHNLDLAERKKYLDIVIRNGKSLIRIIDDILDLSKIEAGKLEIEKTPVSLVGLLQEVLTMFFDRASRKNIQLIYEASEINNLNVITDAVRARQVLINLIGNAIKFTTKGSVKVSCHVNQVSTTQRKVTFSIEDSGIGMTQEQAYRLFQPFTQADIASTRRFGGTGLGLALSRNLARALGGDVDIKNCQVNKGCTFEFSFVAEETNLTASATPAPLPELKNSMAGLKVLAVDDSPDNRELIKMILSQSGLDVTEAESGEDAIQQAFQQQYDIILMDIQMPGLDGYGTLAELRRRGYQAPVLALTAHAMKEEKNRTLAAGFADHVTKPINSEILLQTIQSHVKNH